MIVVFWIALAGILLATGVVVGSIVKLRLKPRWGIVPTNHLIRESATVPVPGSAGRVAKIFLYRSTDFEGHEFTMPGIIVVPRKDKKYPYFEHWCAHFALQGYRVAGIETSTLPKKHEEFIEAIKGIMPGVKQVLCAQPGIDGGRLGIFGETSSALAALLAAEGDLDFKIIGCLSLARLEPSTAMKCKGRVVLAHCMDDKVVPYETFLENKKLLEIPDDKYLLLEMGGHQFNSQEAVVAAFISIQFRDALEPRYRQITPETRISSMRGLQSGSKDRLAVIDTVETPAKGLGVQRQGQAAIDNDDVGDADEGEVPFNAEVEAP